MKWARYTLSQMMSQCKMVIEFDGMTEAELESALQNAAVQKMDEIEKIIGNSDQDDSGKVAQIRELLSLDS